MLCKFNICGYGVPVGVSKVMGHTIEIEKIGGVITWLELNKFPTRYTDSVVSRYRLQPATHLGSRERDITLSALNDLYGFAVCLNFGTHR